MPAGSKVPQVRLGKSGLKISKIILGCMSYGNSEWQEWVLGEEEGIKHIKAAWELGITTFDTANVYSAGDSEVVLGKAIKELKIPRDQIVVLTKCYFPVSDDKSNLLPYGPEGWTERGYANRHGLSRKHIFESIKASLERLQLDYVDVLQIHRFDYETPIEETMQALHDVVKAGYARYIGASSMWAHQFAIMQNYALNNHLTPFISMQNLYNAVYREEERDMIPLCRHYGVGVIPWSPLARGFLTRPTGEKTTRSDTDRSIGALISEVAAKDINGAVEKIATSKGQTMAQIALAYVLAKDDISAPIIGSTKLDSIKELVEGVDIKLTAEEVKTIDDIYTPRTVFGHK